MKMFILFLFLLNSFKAEQIWFVQFSSKTNSLSHIEQSFPLIDLLEHDYHQSAYIFLLPDEYLSNFARFISQSNGFYRIIFDNTTNVWEKSSIRSKRSILSDNPLDEVYYQNYFSHDEQQEWYHLLENTSLTKKFIRLHTIGHTYENRSLTVVQIHTNSPRRYQRRRRKLAVFIDGGMHAREWLSVGVTNFILIKFLLLKEENVKIKEILRYFDIFLLPLMNPDGYEYSRSENRLWRKNRSPTFHSDYWNGDQPCYGIDLNRNFPYQWNTTSALSIHPCSQSYRGLDPSSENEVRSVVNFLRTNKSSHHKFHVYFNLHAYGRFWLLPWTYSIIEKVPNYNDLLERSQRVLANVMNGTYKVGQASLLLYPCSGTSIDFAATLMPHAMTLELSPMFEGLPQCLHYNKTFNNTCTIGFLTGPEAIEIDGNEIFNALVEYLYSIVLDRFPQ